MPVTPPKSTLALPVHAHRKFLGYGSGSDEAWPEHIQAIFVDGLKAWARLSGGRSRWRNQYLVEYLHEKGITRSNKQVASHLHVLRHMWRGEPEYHLVAGANERLYQSWQEEVCEPLPDPSLPMKSLWGIFNEGSESNQNQNRATTYHNKTNHTNSDINATTNSHPAHPEKPRLQPEPENVISESIQNQPKHRDTPSEIHLNETIHTNSHNTTTTTNSNSHNVNNITNVHHHHYHEPKQRRWSITTFVHQIVTVCVPVFWYPHSSSYHAPQSSCGGVNGWWEWIWTQCGWQWGWRWGG
ncbi:hypothetical protein PM082_010397 [Marasmius tenuissimus]|nr:hypothetical protein PM082_010397 [Marasmius tenuissimus]